MGRSVISDERLIPNKAAARPSATTDAVVFRGSGPARTPCACCEVATCHVISGNESRGAAMSGATPLYMQRVSASVPRWHHAYRRFQRSVYQKRTLVRGK